MDILDIIASVLSDIYSDRTGVKVTVKYDLRRLPVV